MAIAVGIAIPINIGASGQGSSLATAETQGKDIAQEPGVVARAPVAGTDPRASWKSILASSGFLEAALPESCLSEKLPAPKGNPDPLNLVGTNTNTGKSASATRDIKNTHTTNSLTQSKADLLGSHPMQLIQPRQTDNTSSLIADFVVVAPAKPQPVSAQSEAASPSQESAIHLDVDLPAADAAHTAPFAGAATQMSTRVQPGSFSQHGSEKQSPPVAVPISVDFVFTSSRSPVGSGVDSMKGPAGDDPVSVLPQSLNSARSPLRPPASEAVNLEPAKITTEASPAIASLTPVNPKFQPTPLQIAPRSEGENATCPAAVMPSREHSSVSRPAATPAIPTPTVTAHISEQTSDSILGREAPGAQAGGSSFRDFNSPASSPAPSPAPSETFEALDASSSTIAPTWIHAGTHTAEAGYQDPALGWVGIRAQSNASGIHATLVPGSADAAQSIGIHLAGLNSYLTARHVPVQSLTMSPHEELSAPAENCRQGSQNPGQGTHQQGEPQAAIASRRQIPEPPKPASAQSALSLGAPSGAPPILADAGHSISVMA